MLSVILILVIILWFVLWILQVYWKYERSKYLKQLPGPKPVFLLGNLDEFLFLPREKYFSKLQEFINQYGPMFRVHVGPKLVGVISSDVKFAEFILTSSKTTNKSLVYGFLHGWLGTGLLTSAEAAMGIQINAQESQTSKYVKSVNTMCEIFIDRVTSPMPNFLYRFTPNYYREQKAIKILHDQTDKIIDTKIREKSKNGNIHYNQQDESTRKRLAFLDLLLESTIDGNPLSRLAIREEVDTFMFAGHDTTATAISFALYCLAMNPRVQERAFIEQKEMFCTDLKTAKPTINQLQEMKYLEMVIKESLRLYPSVPFLGRAICDDEEFIWEGNVFGKGIDILICIYHMHRNPKYFHDPDTFIPERFEEVNKYNSFIFLPFSAGFRNCIGQKFAMLEMKSIISKVLRNFELLPTDPPHEVKVVPNIVIASTNGIHLTLRNRPDD
ncbi:cytochrome P450 4d2-like isoform X2 [Diabrotica undecimpunctata]|uniref:cytochrome P450 4d2-like isoform X2 n=1 Tax=Diabrotica undecimpunctata TaxID=50387 RepID=UPI003B6404EB